MKLALGTAQFGLDYGIANATGQVARGDAVEILAQAAQAGVDTLDTAIAYGESEAVLGSVGVGGWRLVTKLPGLPEDIGPVDAWVEGQLRESLARLKVEAVDSLMLHRPAQLLGEQGGALWSAMERMRERGLVRRLGVSIYAPDELNRLSGCFPIDIVQAPLNLLDRRLMASGWADRLVERGVELHTRSAFLQGLLLMREDERPAKFSRWAPVWSAFSEWLASSGLTALEACLGYALSCEAVSRVVVGVDSLRQFDEILLAARPLAIAPPALPTVTDEAILNPACWATL